MLQWYLFRVRARAEQTVSKQVEAMGYSTFLPQVLKRSRPHDSAIMSPLFPGYLFIRLDPYRASFAPVLKLFGMIDIIRTTGEIRPVELALVVSLRRRCQANPELVLDLEDSVPKVGEAVRFSYGAFNQIEALFHEMADDKRCRLLITLINQEQLIEVPLTALER